MRKLCNTNESGIRDTVSVYKLPSTSASPYGIIGMCGNVAEWTNSWYSAYPLQPFVLKGYGKVYKVIRGGSYLDDSRNAKSFHRSYGGNPNLREDKKAGFRLVVDYRP
jgi:formylglycine-generating enzyme required for sulfatase activity